MKQLIIEIEGYGLQALLHGKCQDSHELRKKFFQTLRNLHGNEDFLHVFCRDHQFEEVPYSGLIEADFLLDVDVLRVFKNEGDHWKMI
ncbi:hypothetical protein SAMN05444392_10768 [Seinonella peptonophila]|uniref:Uncharacterized protein n=1 Tax=Seinonella peptonophila TaxID=112248 RepID=A0A1M4YP50_9BACL|nr:hypothetical protein [Seinonella peptonophila]SHF07550.1 hypothetical protein SAMN05444392_10768 [Seinonella peptonophila]